ncbi:MAG: dockerin type I domain-containing protein [Clostridiales bacterium]|nr:dockerin type I domain-containing protein [Clostridiales bacterium]
MLQGSVYDETAPQMAEVDGNRVMVFLTDDGSRDDINRTKLVYSVYDENLDTWSLPEAINDDGTADFYPNLAGDGNNIWLTWHKSKIVFSNDSSIDELLAASEIAVARFDKVTGKFTDIAVLTDNNVLDTQPKIAVNGNNVFVTWIENTANDLFGINGKNNKIMVRQYTDGAWSTPVTLVGGLGAVTDMAAGYLGGNARVAYITDADNDLTTFVDRNLTVTDLTGTVTNSPASTKLVSNPSFSTINNESVLSWYETGMSWEEDEDGENYEYLEAGNIRYLTAGGQVKKLFDEADMMTDNYKIINDGAGNSAVIYPGQEDETGFIFAKLYNAGQWGKAFKLAKTGNFARFFDSVWQSSGEFYLAFNNSRIDIGGEDDDVLFREKNDLCVMKVAPAANIALADVLYSDEDVRLGEKLPISLDIENIGGIPINSVLIKTNDETVSTCGLAGGLLTGEQATLEFELDIPANMPKETDFTLSVEPSNAEDADPSDNSRTITLGHTNLILSLDKEYNDDNTVKVIANVENDSDYIANTKLLVYRGDLEGDLIETIEMGEITSRQSMSREFDFNPYRLIPKGEEYETLYFEIVSDKYELYSANKSDFVVIFANNAGGYGSNGEFLAPIDDPDLGAIKIYTAQDLDNVRNDLSGSYVLMNDLDLADFKGGQWAPIGSNTSTDRFTGTFDGQGYLIKNLTITGGANQYVGLFGYAGNATIKNVGLEGSNINISTTYGGGICGYIISDTVINNCYNAGPVSSGRYAGGICSYANSGTISNCYSTGEVLASSPSSYSWAGGICGFSSGSIVNCYNTGDITSYSSYAPISNAIIYSYAGGICAEIDGEDTVISDCHNTGNIYAYAFSSNEISPYAGGICGAGRYVLISNCYNAGIVSTPYGDGYAGGISGWLLDHSISNCYNSGDVFSANAGGIYGGAAIHAPNSVINCYNSGNVSAFHYAGGIYGKSSGNGSVSNCLVLSPRIDGELGSYPIGFPDPIEPTLKINNLALLGISGISIDDSNDRISLAEAKSQATYEDLGWDFENTWRMDPDYDYPQLKGVEFKRPPTGFNVSGRIKSYDPNNSTIICLRQDNEERYTITLNGTGGYSQIEQEFCFEGVDPGRYDLVITKDAHTKFTVQNLKVDNNDLDLSEDSRPEVKLMILRCGDINGDGLINDADLTLLWRAGNYNKKANEADNRACDLNGDGLINDADLTILWLAYNYNRGEIVIQPEIALSLNLSASNLNAQAAGDKFTVGVTSNTGWSVSSNVTWATAGKNSGSGNEEFTIKVDPNTFTSTRTALITVKADSGSSDKISYIIVNQAAFGPIDPSLDLSPKNISATDKGGAYSIDVTSNTGWTVSSNVTWAKTGISNGSGNDDLLITVDPNPAATTRTALITVKTTYGSGDKTDHIMINQDSAGVIIPDLDLSSGNVSAQGEGDTISIGVTSNTSWSVSANVTWTRIDSATGAQNGDITISVDPNNTSGTRTALITVKTTSGSDDVSRYLIITQPPAALGYPVAINSVFPALIF